ncbi:Hypothetical predicted protein [Podarcis lilfordi]|uniref:Uncharacterized protein n=1 Tax=Podarcis lilfordi TaxID=74358 RepID=A0AA35K8U9_9SAUR|nr:Hypothetical predicted protein [Podarcis lilfordi]
MERVSLRALCASRAFSSLAPSRGGGDQAEEAPPKLNSAKRLSTAAGHVVRARAWCLCARSPPGPTSRRRSGSLLSLPLHQSSSPPPPPRHKHKPALGWQKKSSCWLAGAAAKGGRAEQRDLGASQIWRKEACVCRRAPARARARDACVRERPQNCKVNTLSSSLCFLSLWLDSYSSPGKSQSLP